MRQKVVTSAAVILVLMLCAAAGARGATGAPGVPAPSPVVPDGAWSHLLETRGRLLGPPERLRARAAARPDLYRATGAYESMQSAAIRHVVDGLSEEETGRYIARAMERVRAGVTNIHHDTYFRMMDVAFVYDFFYDSISEADRAAMIEWLNAHLGVFVTDENAFHNSTLVKILCYLRVAYATWGDNPRAGEFRDYALLKLYEGKIVPVLNEFGAGGGFTEGGWYARSSLFSLVEAIELARRIDGYDGYEKAPRFYYQRLAYELLQPYPGLWVYGSQRYAVEGDGSLVFGGSNVYPRLMRHIIAQYFAGSELAGYTETMRRPPANSLARVMDLIYDEPIGDSLPLDEFPPAHLAAGIGKAYARSHWGDDASWLRFECGDYYNGHQHFEVGNFEVFRYEPLATESGEYVDYLSDHSVNWLIRTIAHNCITVYMPGETWSMLRDGGRHTYANDGGQAKKWSWTADNLEEWMARRETFERGRIIAYENRDEYFFIAGDCTSAYSPEKLKNWVRQILFIRPHTFVIFDSVVSPDASFTKTWRLHCRNEPELSGDTFTVRDGKGTLVATTLLPADARIESAHGYAYGGREFPERHSVQAEAAARWRVEVTPGKEREKDLFLHVISTDGPVEARLIREGDVTGVAFADAIVRFSEDAGGTLEIGERGFTLDREIKTGTFE